GLLALELAERRAQEVAGWLAGGRDWEAVTLRDDLAGRPRVLLARRQRGPAIAPAQWNEEGWAGDRRLAENPRGRARRAGRGSMAAPAGGRGESPRGRALRR